MLRAFFICLYIPTFADLKKQFDEKDFYFLLYFNGHS